YKPQGTLIRGNGMGAMAYYFQHPAIIYYATYGGYMEAMRQLHKFTASTFRNTAFKALHKIDSI
ncbi:MAG: hypothetical protein AAFQ98_19015, partial [Bacteroidota bacterium]